MAKDIHVDTDNQELFEINPYVQQAVTEDLTPEELEKLILDDVHAIYEMKDAV